MPSESRAAIINQARERNEFSYDLWRYALGIVEQMEAGLTLYEVIAKAESKKMFPENELLLIDAASSWVRANSVALKLKLG